MIDRICCSETPPIFLIIASALLNETTVAGALDQRRLIAMPYFADFFEIGGSFLKSPTMFLSSSVMGEKTTGPDISHTPLTTGSMA